MNENYKAYLKADLDKYEGQWVVFVKGSMVSAGDDLKGIVEAARKEYGKDIVPFVVKVPKKMLMSLSPISLEKN